ETNFPDETEKLVTAANNMYEKTERLKLKSWLINRKQNHSVRVAANTLFLLISLPVFIYGFLFNAIPFFLIDRVIRKKVKDPSFWSTFFLVAGVILFPLFYLLELLAVSWLIPEFWLKIAFLISLPFAGKLAFNWYILLRKTKGRCRLLWLKWFNFTEYKQLLKEKKQLFEKLDKLIIP
ncbi:hypothetical protein, partial [Mariniphaga sediminis]|uniref:hypothetical protein n=1 Tax=Mariniphaga sediminis TaxID=1628158 RepID=UPI00356A8CD0